MNRTLSDNDFWWTISLFISSILVYGRWINGGWMPLVWLSAYNSILALTLHLQLHKKSFYLRNRIQFLVAMRYIRLLGVILLVDRSIPDMLRIQETSCGYTIFKVLLYRIGYILTTFVGYQVPLKHQIWVIMLNLVVMSVLSIQQCKQEAEKSK